MTSRRAAARVLRRLDFDVSCANVGVQGCEGVVVYAATLGCGCGGGLPVLLCLECAARLVVGWGGGVDAAGHRMDGFVVRPVLPATPFTR